MKHHATYAHTLAAAHTREHGERQTLDAHLRACQACGQEAAAFEAAAAPLAAAGSQPPPASARAQVMAAIDQVRQLPPHVPATATPGNPLLLMPLRLRAR
ncbi:hypothetical protein [Streptomyces sp. NPDC101132]|uniref:hypothetical protein n=1 Tax=Streptomyces sp. NPDC101132 TaxID=3366110 RepID=UPI00380A39FE